MHPWGRVSEIRSIKETRVKLFQIQIRYRLAFLALLSFRVSSPWSVQITFECHFGVSIQIRSNMQICATREFHGTVTTVGS